jgi:hypothetical protein
VIEGDGEGVLEEVGVTDGVGDVDAAAEKVKVADVPV